mmetsp:Transcript_49383/g.139860  ORF Transcript_49383/g.139860 Transcript_49383/m.139860 type:complete len:387 (+) Transcript_49383:123-1283(+)
MGLKAALTVLVLTMHTLKSHGETTIATATDIGKGTTTATSAGMETEMSTATGMGAGTATAPNVLLILSDDMRPQLSFGYDQDYMVTPCLDRLARESIIFDSAFAQFGVCAPSRNSFMSGRRPDTTRVWNFIQHFRQENLSEVNPGFNKDWVSLPQFFKENGYLTMGSGKIFHWEPDTGYGTPPSNDYPTSWSTDKPYVAAGDDGCGDGSTYLFCPDPAHPADSDAYDDYAMTMAAIDHIRYAVSMQRDDGGEGSGQRPFFVGLGTYRPHMRAHLPSSVVDLYPYEDIRVAQHPHPPAGGVPPFSFKSQVDEGSATVSLPAYVVGNATDTDGDVVFTAPSLIQPDTFPEYFQQASTSITTWYSRYFVNCTPHLVCRGGLAAPHGPSD